MDETSILDFFGKRLSAHREIRRILLFGSRARGMASESSDFDLCLIVAELPDARTLYVELMRESAPPDIAAYHFHQAVEKTLKGIIALLLSTCEAWGPRDKPAECGTGSHR